jgi:hypothetical protein
MSFRSVLKYLLESDLQKESSLTLHRWIVRPAKKGNRFSAMLFFVSYFGLCYYDALLWSYHIFEYLGFVVIRCLVALLLFIPNIFRFPFHTSFSFVYSYMLAIGSIWIFGFMDGIFNGPESEKYERPGVFYLFPLFIFGNIIYVIIADLFGSNLGFYEAINNSKFGFYPIILLFILWPIATNIWFRIEKSKTNKSTEI